MTRFKRLLAVVAVTAMMMAIVLLVTNSASARRQSVPATTATFSPAAYNPGAFLTGPNAGAPLDIALNYITQNREALGLTAADVADMAVSDQYVSQHNGVTHIYLRQQHNGISVYNGLLNINIASDGSVINIGNRFVSNLSGRISSAAPALTAEQAVAAAAQSLGLTIAAPLVVEEAAGGTVQAVVFNDAGISLEPIPVELAYQPTEQGDVRLAWDLSIYELDGQDWWSMRIDAASGAVLAQDNWVVNDYWGPGEAGHSHGPAALPTSSGNLVELSASMVPTGYLVYPMPVESPNFGIPAPPADARVDHVTPWFDAPNASPYGWQDLDGDFDADTFHTRGNNVDAYEDSNNSNGPTNGNASRGRGGPTLDFSPPLNLNLDPTQSITASIVNLYYWNNIVHDVMYEYGFDEAGGNFQFMNYTGNGFGGDSVQAEAQDGGGNCNANFGTPPDGSRPRMQQYLCNLASPRRDSSLDNGVIAHEYGHGISNRLTGGPSNTGCLGNQEQMGEGWSDWVSYMLTIEPGDAGDDARHIGTWLFGTGPGGPGIRLFPYSTDFADNPQTYDSIKTNGTSPHSLGEVWALMLWEVLWNLIDKHGFNPDVYDAWNTGGNNLMLQLVTDGMKMQPCAPGMVDGRDAILAADMALTGGANQCDIWAGFAKRGLGYSADQGSSGSRTDGTEAFDMPGFCSLQGLPESQDICAGDTAVYNVDVGPLNAPAPINMSASGHPGGTTATFSPNPVVTLPNTTTLTIGSTGGAAAGNYDITIKGTNAAATETTTMVSLNVFDTLPAAPALSQPADGASGVSARPAFQWAAVAEATVYTLEVDDDPGFGSIDYMAVVEGTSHTPADALVPESTYYWRVTPGNACGGGTTSAVWSFTVDLASLSCRYSTPAIDFSGGIPADWQVVNNAGSEATVWVTTSDSDCNTANSTNGSGEAACADSFATNSGPFDTELVSPPFDLTEYDAITLDTAAYYNDLNTGSNDRFEVDVWDGSSWNNELTWDEDHRPGNISLDLVAYAGLTDVRIRFRYSGDGFDGVAQVDNVDLVCQGPTSDLYMPVITNDSGSSAAGQQGSSAPVLPVGGIVLLPAMGGMGLIPWLRRRD